MGATQNKRPATAYLASPGRRKPCRLARPRCNPGVTLSPLWQGGCRLWARPRAAAAVGVKWIEIIRAFASATSSGSIGFALSAAKTSARAVLGSSHTFIPKRRRTVEKIAPLFTSQAPRAFCGEIQWWRRCRFFWRPNGYRRQPIWR
jgi:hypothetical protein